MGGRKVFSTLEEIYGGKWYIGKRGRLRECKEVGRRVWRKAECRS